MSVVTATSLMLVILQLSLFHVTPYPLPPKRTARIYLCKSQDLHWRGLGGHVPTREIQIWHHKWKMATQISYYKYALFYNNNSQSFNNVH